MFLFYKNEITISNMLFFDVSNFFVKLRGRKEKLITHGMNKSLRAPREE